MKQYLKSAGIFNLVIIAGFIVLVIMRLNKVSMIISMGIRTTNFILTAVLIGLIALFLLGNALLYLKNKQAIQRDQLQREVKEEEAAIQQEQSANSPRYIKSELDKLLPLRPKLRMELEEGHSQLTSIERKEKTFGEILRRNQETDSLDEVMHTLEETKGIICLNLSKIINRALLWDPEEAEDDPDIYAVSKGFIYGYLKLNDSLLDKCNILLNDSLAFLEGRSGNQNSELGLDIMIETMQSLKNTNSEIKSAHGTKNEMDTIEHINFGLKKDRNEGSTE